MQGTGVVAGVETGGAPVVLTPLPPPEQLLPDPRIGFAAATRPSVAPGRLPVTTTNPPSIGAQSRLQASTMNVPRKFSTVLAMNRSTSSVG
ncbi:MAG: hypothetical protein R2749_01520 [Acidimicrobiales bacterium]